jgi:hypothetical protein
MVWLGAKTPMNTVRLRRYGFGARGAMNRDAGVEPGLLTVR